MTLTLELDGGRHTALRIEKLPAGAELEIRVRGDVVGSFVLDGTSVRALRDWLDDWVEGKFSVERGVDQRFNPHRAGVNRGG
jgi:hypothetical protein